MIFSINFNIFKKIGLFIAFIPLSCGTKGLHWFLQRPSDPVLVSCALLLRLQSSPRLRACSEALLQRHSKGLTFLELQDGVEDDDAVQSLPANILIRIPNAKDEPSQQKPQCRESRGHLFVL